MADDETQADRIDDVALTPFEKGLSETIGSLIGSERKYFHGYIDDQVSKLREEIGQLRVDHELLRSFVKGKTGARGRV